MPNYRVATSKLEPGLSSSGRPNTVGLSERGLDKVLDALDARDVDAPPRAALVRRRFSRWAFREERVDVVIQHPGGSEAMLQLACRNLSKGGISVLHSSFVYPGAACVVNLPCRGGGATPIPGRVTRCEHIRDVLHELGVKFDKEINPRDFVEPRPLDSRLLLERVDRLVLTGRIVIAEPSAGERQLIRRAARRARATTVEVSTGAEAIEEAGKDAVAIVAALDLPDMPGPGLATAAAAAGVDVPVIVTGERPTGAVCRTLGLHPIAAFLPRPLDENTLHRAFAEFCTEERPASNAVQNARAVFIHQSSTVALQLDRARRRGDAAEVFSVAERLADSAAKLGFGPLGEVANDVAEKLSTEMTIEAAGRELARLVELCREASRAA